MRSSKKAEGSLKSSAQHLTDHKIDTDLAAAWKGLSQSKAALRHIENHLEAVPGTGVMLDSVMNPIKEKSSQIILSRNGIQTKNGGSSKHRRSRKNPEKSSSRSPLRNATQDSNVCRNNGVECRDQLTPYRLAAPPSHPSSQLEMLTFESVPGSSNSSSDPLLSQMVYQRDTRDKQTDRDLDSTHSSALMSTEVRYLNDLPALETLKTNGYQSPLTTDRAPVREWNGDNRTPNAHLDFNSQHSSPYFASLPGSLPRGEGTPSSSPGSASQRLENLRRHQPDDKLEKLKERIRRQRQHLEEAAEKSKVLGFQEQPITAAVETNISAPTVKIRKIAPAPPAPIYRGFNSTETKIRTPDGKVWKEEEFHNLSREIYRDLTQQFAELTKSRHQRQREQKTDMSKEKRPSKPVRKVHKATAAPDLNAKPGISAASWRDGQKLVKMVLGPLPKPSRETDLSHQVDGPIETASPHRSGSGPHSKSKHQPRPHSKERPLSGHKEQLNGHCAAGSTLPQEKASLGVSKDLLSADIQGILDDLQLDYESTEKVERARQRSRCESRGKRGRGGSGSRTRTPISAWGTTVVTRSSSRGCRSASPTTNRSEMANVADAGSKKRHYDANAIRQYIVQQKEERKKRQEEEKRALREETERRNHRLQELYRKQKEVARTVPSELPVPSVQKHLQLTYNKLLLEESQLSEEATLMHIDAPFSEMRPMYQPSGESDKENLRVDAPQSPSSSDRSLNEQPPALSRNDLDGVADALLPADYHSPAVRPKTAPSSHMPTPVGDNLLSQLLRLEMAMAGAEVRHHDPPATVSTNRSNSKISRIEALKATAASLSNRIESEARKIAGEGINYGTATLADVDGILAPPSETNLENGCWPETGVTENNNNNSGTNAQRILNGTGHSLYDATFLPGVGNLHAFRGKKELMNTHIISTSPQTSGGDVTRQNLSSTQEHRKMLNGLEKEELKYIKDRSKRNDNAENQVELHDSSAGSISEGPILSEASFSEDEAHSPLHATNSAFTPANGVEAVDYCAGQGQRKDFQRLSEFQREAAKCPALTSTFTLQDNSNAAWEELNKGSPLSVINIFTRNLNKHVKVNGLNSPSAQSFDSGNGLRDSPVYEDDFVSPQSCRTTSQSRKSPSVNSHFEELMRRSPYDKGSEGINSHRSSFQSPVHSQHLSSDSLSVSSPRSRHSGAKSERSDVTLVEAQRSPCSPLSEVLSSDSRKRGSDRSSSHSKAKSVHSGDTLGECLNRSHHSLGRDGRKSSSVTPKHASPLASSISGSPPGEVSPSDFVRGDNKNTGTTTQNIREETGNKGDLHYSPAVLQQRMAAEFQYLESIEESVRQLDNMERLMCVTMAQQESSSLAQLLKAKQQRHEHDLYELKIKAEREALEAQLQLEENRQRMTRAHIELQEKLAGSQKETLEGLQEATTKMMSQQAEAAQHTADAARHIKEMTELARTQVVGALVVAPAPNKSMLDRRDEQEKHLHPKQSLSESFLSEVSSRQARPDDPPSSLNSLSHSDSMSFKRPGFSETNTSSHNSSSYSPAHRDQTNKEADKVKRRKGRAEGRNKREGGSSSIEEEVPTAANDSLCSESIPFVRDEKGDSTSVATEYSLKFDESMTEDDIEERSFRSLLPSEAHRRGTLEKKSQPREGSEDDHVSHSTLFSEANNILKPLDASMSFSGGQDSFSQFTMDMVRQYMKDEEVRLQHQSSLLRLRQKAVREKTKTELAWLEHQKKRLRDKGEDDKMPPIRKKQRGLLLKLQQEQAEIKRLQEANKAARKERQLLMKQQEEIERMRTTTLRLKERLKCVGGEVPSELLASETPASEPVSPTRERRVDENRSPSPSLSVSGSETSSIMQKLKKMRTQMDEKFLTKREQQLMQRRHHAEELLQWKQRLDQEEAEVRRMEKEALAVWNKRTAGDVARDVSQSQKHDISDLSFQQSSGLQNHSEKEFVSEGDMSSATESSIHTEESGSQQPGSPSSLKPVSVTETPLASVKSSLENYSQDFTSPSRHSSILKGSRSPAASPSDGSSKTKMQIHSSSRTAVQTHIRPQDFPQSIQKESISDQSDIESRINALKEELRKRKSLAYQLKKEQKKRHKERLKAKEASLLRELENCNSFIEKTKAELNKGTDQIPDIKSQTSDSTSDPQHSRIKSLDHRSEKRQVSESEQSNVDALSNHIDHSESASLPDLSDEDPPTVTQTPVNASPDCLVSGQRSHHTSEELVRPSSISNKVIVPEDDNVVSDQTSEVQEELERELSSRLDEHNSECLLKLEGEDGSDFHVEHPPTSKSEIEILSPSEAEDVSNLKLKSLSVPVDHKPSTRPTSVSSSSTSSCEPDSVANSLKKEAPMKGAENVFTVTDDCYDELKASDDISPNDQHFSSKEKLNEDLFWQQNNSQSEDLEEGRAKELGQQSITSESSALSGGLVDLCEQTDDFKHDSKSIHTGHSPPLSPVRDEMADFNIGDRVLVGSVQPGTLRFKGPTSFANGFWAGVELDKSEGSNNGTYDGVVYFKCNDRHGIFAPPEKITQLPEKFEVYADTTEDEDEVIDNLTDRVKDKCQTDEEKNQNQENLESNHDSTPLNDCESLGDVPHTDHELDHEDTSELHSESHKEPRPLSNGSSQDIMLDLETSEIILGKQNKSQITLHVEKVDVDAIPEFTPTEASVTKDIEKKAEPDKLDSFTDKLLKSFISDTVEKFAEIKKAKVEKIEAANQNNREPFCADLEEDWISSVEQKDGLPFFPPPEKEELSSPELCNRPESPVLGASGQEELAKRLAELELSRELLDDLCDDQDWFDEDFGLSSRREQQRQKQKQREEEEELRLGGFGAGSSISSATMGGLVPSPGGEQHVKSPPRPELPLPLPPKLPEQPALVVPHSATEVEKMVHAATEEIWEHCGLANDGAVTLTQTPNPQPSQEYLGKEASGEDQDALFIRSYKKGVYDLTLEILQEIYAEDPNANQPLWVKPRRVKASFHRIKTSGDIATVQAYVTAEVLKLYGLSKDQSQKTDWQKMLKFGRKKRDRVDHILVQELHEEESQWVNYDEDELSVKMQLADSILDALLKDTANVLTLIYDKRRKRDAPS